MRERDVTHCHIRAQCPPLPPTCGPARGGSCPIGTQEVGSRCGSEVMAPSHLLGTCLLSDVLSQTRDMKRNPHAPVVGPSWASISLFPGPGSPSVGKECPCVSWSLWAVPLNRPAQVAQECTAGPGPPSSPPSPRASGHQPSRPPWPCASCAVSSWEETTPGDWPQWRRLSFSILGAQQWWAPGEDGRKPPGQVTVLWLVLFSEVTGQTPGSR